MLAFRSLRANKWRTYINWIGTESLSDFFIPADHVTLELQGVGAEADDEEMNLRFPVEEDGRTFGRLYVHTKRVGRLQASRPLERGFLMSLSFKAPLAATADTSDMEESMYRGRNAIVRVFTALTKPNWHEIWERTA